MQQFKNQFVITDPNPLNILDMKVFRKALLGSICLKNESLD